MFRNTARPKLQRRMEEHRTLLANDMVEQRAIESKHKQAIAREISEFKFENSVSLLKASFSTTRELFRCSAQHNLDWDELENLDQIIGWGALKEILENLELEVAGQLGASICPFRASIMSAITYSD